MRSVLFPKLSSLIKTVSTFPYSCRSLSLRIPLLSLPIPPPAAISTTKTGASLPLFISFSFETLPSREIGFSQPQAPVPTPLAGWMSNPTTVAHPAVSGGAIGLGAPSIPGCSCQRSRCFCQSCDLES